MRGEFFDLECRYIDCDGVGFGYVSCEVNIDKFERMKKIVDLDGYPIHLHPNIQSLVDRLHASGKKLEQLNGFYHMSYSGRCTARSTRQIRKRQVSHQRLLLLVDAYSLLRLNQVERSRIIIDPQGFGTYGPSGPGSGLDSASLQAASPIDDSMIYKATSQAFQEYKNALGRHEEPKRDHLSCKCAPLPLHCL